MKSTSIRLRAAALVGGVGLAVTVLSAPAQAAQVAPEEIGTAAVTCGNQYWPHENWDTGSGRTIDQAPVRTGPYSACSPTAYLSPGTYVTYDCYTVNDYGNTWTWVRSSGGASIGWVYDGHLDDGGATVRCPRY